MGPTHGALPEQSLEEKLLERTLWWDLWDFTQLIGRKLCGEQNLESLILDSFVNLPDKAEGLVSAVKDRFFAKWNTCVESMVFVYNVS